MGAAHMAVAEDPPPHGVARRLADVIGWPRTLWALGALSILAHGPLAEDEAYVGEVAVAADARRQGVGAMLMPTSTRRGRAGQVADDTVGDRRQRRPPGRCMRASDSASASPGTGASGAWCSGLAGRP